MKKSLVIVVVSIAVVSGVLALWLLRQNTANPDAITIPSDTGGSLAASSVKDDLAASPESNLPPYQGDPIDNIGSDPFIQQVPTDYLEKYKQELANFKKTLAENPGDTEGWTRVGVLKKFFNNYKGARDVWEYAKIVNPKFSTPYYNLGGLYAGYLRDNPKAEENYLKAIEIDPSLSYLYLGLAEFYSVFYKEKADQAASVILEGLKVNPDEPSLLKALETYK